MACPWIRHERAPVGTQTAFLHCAAARRAANPLRIESGNRCRRRGRARRRAQIFPPRASPEKTARWRPCADNRHKKTRRARGSRQNHLFLRIDATGIQPVGGELRRARTRRHDRNSSPGTQPLQISSRKFSLHIYFITAYGDIPCCVEGTSIPPESAG